MSRTDFHALAVAFAHEKLKGWRDVTISNSKLTQFVGNSNKVFLFEPTILTDPPKVVFRYFGPNEITDKARERKIYTKLTQHGLAPQNFGDSSTCRLEFFLDGYQPVENRFFGDLDSAAKVAKKLRIMHCVDMREVLQGEGLMTDLNMRKWRDIILNKISIYGEAQNAVLEVIKEENFEVYDRIIPKDSPIVFSHLDPSMLNILYHPDKKSVFLIDYEFSGFAYRAVDFALMLNESQIDYLYAFSPFYRLCPEMRPTDEIVKHYVTEYGEGKEMWVEVKRCLAATHLIWALWSLAMYSGPSEGYNYLSFGLMRFSMFKTECDQYEAAGGLENLQKTAEAIFS
jgi:thiamine kinase-like enzyme